ncbi:hypothetical protein RN629_07715 [Sphingomonadaceae bacterium jetA1]|jgi:ribonuclease HI|uniref:reverse transcriptase-like protein n=1 Tax=Facivitalis istanbulensis TaxID=3075838 RepID=UPI00347599E7
MSGPVKLFFDGGLRPLPAGMEWAVVLRGRARLARGLGPGGSMAAEWLALIAATRLVIEEGLTDALLLGDAAAVIAQAQGTVRVPPSCRALHRAWCDLPPPPGRLRLRHIRRTQNLAGIALAKASLRQPL